MTFGLTILTLTALLATSLRIPCIVIPGRPGNAPHKSFERMARVWDVCGTARRACRAHLNPLDQFLPFVAVVVVAHLAGVSDAVTAWASGLLLVLRVVHAAGYIAGWTRMPRRPLLFTGSWLCILVIAATVLLS